MERYHPGRVHPERFSDNDGKIEGRRFAPTDAEATLNLLADDYRSCILAPLSAEITNGARKKLQRESVNLAVSFLTLDEALDIGLTPKDIDAVNSANQLDLTSGVITALMRAHDLLDNDTKILAALQYIAPKRQSRDPLLELCLEIGPIKGSLDKTLFEIRRLNAAAYTMAETKIALGVNTPHTQTPPLLNVVH